MVKNFILSALIFKSLITSSVAAPFEITVIDSAVDFTHEYLKKNQSPYGVFDVHMNKPLDETKRRLLSFFGEYTHATHVAGIIASHLSDGQINNALINSAYFIKVGTKVNEEAFNKLENYLNDVDPRIANLSIAEQYKFAIEHTIKEKNITAEDEPSSILSAHEKIMEIFNTHMSEQNQYWIELFNNFPNTLFVIAAGNDSRLLSSRIYQTEKLPKTWKSYKEKLLAGKIPGFKSLVAQINLPNTITVGSFEGSELTLSNFSNYGNQFVDILADGDKINSTLPDGKWGLNSGTSMAAPQVTGLAASILENQLNLSVKQLKKAIYRRAKKSTAFEDYSEDGRYLINEK